MAPTRTRAKPLEQPSSRGACARRGAIVLLLVTASLCAANVAFAQAPEAEHDYTFGQTARFTLTLPNDSPAQQATFYLQINGDRTAGFDVPVVNGQTEVDRNLAAEPLPPYAHLTYWWSYPAVSGTVVETEKTGFQYVDNRYAWQTVEGEAVTVHWVSGERSVMIQAVDIAETALAQFQEALDTEQIEDTAIYIYPSRSDLASAMQLAGFDWAGGVAYPELGVVLVGIPSTVEAPITMQQDIPHELIHRALYDWLGAQGYASLPTWLNEGLAMAFEARPDALQAVVLQEAQQADTLISLAELCLPFPDDSERAQLAYAQSKSIVDYLRRTYGWSGLRRLILAYADGKACSAGLQEGLGQDLTATDREWRLSLDEGQQPAEDSGAHAEASLLWRDTRPWLVLLAALLLPGLALVIANRR